MCSSSFLQVGQKFIKILSFLTLIFLSTVLLFGFQEPEKSDTIPINKERIEKFLKHLMIENQGVYTLVGSKPMTLFTLVPIIDEVEKSEIYTSHTEQFKRHIPFEKFKLERGDCRKLWDDWKQVQDQYIGKQFHIVEDDKTGNGIFINVPAVIFVLDKWYDEFAKITGMIFNPFEAVFSIGDRASPFWQKAQKNHYLLGLLLGYGEQNAKYFQWEKEKKMQYPMRRGTNIFPAHTGKAAHDLVMEDLDVPGFIVYQAIDEQLEKYKLEKDRCINLYKGEDFYKLTVELLKGIPPKREERKLTQESKLLIEQWVGYNSRIQ